MPRSQSSAFPPNTASNVLAVIENKRDKFRRLANQRAKHFAKTTKAIGRLSTSTYDRTPEEVEKLVTVLTRDFNFMVEQLRHGAQDGETDDIF